jgi:hypothetical protein
MHIVFCSSPPRSCATRPKLRGRRPRHAAGRDLRYHPGPGTSQESDRFSWVASAGIELVLQPKAVSKLGYRQADGRSSRTRWHRHAHVRAVLERLSRLDIASSHRYSFSSLLRYHPADCRALHSGAAVPSAGSAFYDQPGPQASERCPHLPWRIRCIRDARRRRRRGLQRPRTRPARRRTRPGGPRAGSCCRQAPVGDSDLSFSLCVIQPARRSVLVRARKTATAEQSAANVRTAPRAMTPTSDQRAAPCRLTWASVQMMANCATARMTARVDAAMLDFLVDVQGSVPSRRKRAPRSGSRPPRCSCRRCRPC